MHLTEGETNLSAPSTFLFFTLRKLLNIEISCFPDTFNVLDYISNYAATISGAFCLKINPNGSPTAQAVPRPLCTVEFTET